jgi:Tfp pilus assembly protein PilF
VLGGVYLNRQQFDSAIAEFRQAFAADSSIPQSALFMGHAFNGKNQPDSAKRWYAYMVRREPKNFDALLNLGVAESKLGDWVGARARFAAAINAMPTNNLGWLNRGVANQQLGDVAAACADWQRATSFGSKQAQDYVARFCGGQNAPVP